MGRAGLPKVMRMACHLHPGLQAAMTHEALVLKPCVTATGQPSCQPRTLSGLKAALPKLGWSLYRPHICSQVLFVVIGSTSGGSSRTPRSLVHVQMCRWPCRGAGSEALGPLFLAAVTCTVCRQLHGQLCPQQAGRQAAANSYGLSCHTARQCPVPSAQCVPPPLSASRRATVLPGSPAGCRRAAGRQQQHGLWMASRGVGLLPYGSLRSTGARLGGRGWGVGVWGEGRAE
jgi:hypothetical protein